MPIATYTPPATAVLSRRRALAALAASAALSGRAFAQSERPVRLIINTTAGSGLDGTARAVQSALGQALGRPLMIDNQAGAGGLIGLQSLARAAADGATIGFATNNLVIFPSVLKSVPFDVTRDFCLERNSPRSKFQRERVLVEQLEEAGTKHAMYLLCGADIR